MLTPLSKFEIDQVSLFAKVSKDGGKPINPFISAGNTFFEGLGKVVPERLNGIIIGLPQTNQTPHGKDHVRVGNPGLAATGKIYLV